MSFTNPHPHFDERRWVINIRRTLEEEIESDTEIPVSVFNVPKSLMSTDPDSYTPQEVAIGPYHYLRPELYEMERYKLAAAKRTQRQLNDCGNIKFEYVVDQLIMLVLKIRASYHKFLNFSNETLAWMMAIDAFFLLEFLQICAIKESKVCGSSRSSSSSISHLVDYAGTKSAHNAILRDMVMLENQIPLFVLRKMLQVQYSSLEIADDLLQAMLMGFCEELSPFKLMKDSAKVVEVSDAAHLLDFLYRTIVPKPKQPSNITEIDQIQNAAHDHENDDSYSVATADSNYVKQFFSELWKMLSKLNKGPIRLVNKLIFSKPVKIFLKLPWTILSKLPGFQVIAQPVQYLLFPQENEDKKDVKESGNSNNDMNKPPLVEEITIPSVTELAKSQVRFLPSNGNIFSISFDMKAVTLYLPTISLDINTAVVLRNLVAFEASNASGPLVFTRYTELMNGIIDTEEDVKILREKGIILNRLKSDAEAANLWNGMSKSLRLTKVPLIDKVIEDVNKYYNGRWKVKFGKYIKIYVFGSWQLLTLLATLLLLLLMTLQAVCSVYNCSRKFHITKS
ncbi:hypothetical protein ACOSP7_031129 [Xanthoceras sorbifolium]|uniref:Uncharacterized protein n=1 Tax=Xanthoceras sorbifolium TaxID=99658 RepID=A0ABQ8H168_9ROSI|nr:hypothetical protein JRO89_XS15G0071400 [Xanthoceras sorbifolium]